MAIFRCSQPDSNRRDASERSRFATSSISTLIAMELGSKPPPGSPSPGEQPTPTTTSGSPKRVVTKWMLPLIVVVAVGSGFMIANSRNKHDRGIDSERQARSDDAWARAGALEAADAMEACAVDNEGSYAGCSLAKLKTVVPSVAAAPQRRVITVQSTPNTYTIDVVATETGNRFKLVRDASGSTTRPCTAEDNPRACRNGTW